MVGASGIACAGADQADRDRIDDRRRRRLEIDPVEPLAIPGRARDVDERPALRRGLELALARGHEGRRKFRDVPQRGIVARRSGPMRVRQKHAVAKSRTHPPASRQPVPQGWRIDDIAGLHRPFDAAGIGERTDRKGRRQPGHQPVQRRGSSPSSRPTGAGCVVRSDCRRPPRAAAGRLIYGHEHGNGRGDGRDRNARHGDGHGDDRHDHA